MITQNEPSFAMGRLTQLSSTPGVSGREGDVGVLICDQISPFVESIRVDAYGNLICHKPGKRPVLMLEAHMDEVGFMVQSIEEDGYIKFLPVGPISVPPVTGQRMHLHTAGKRIDGIVGYTQSGSIESYDDVYLDTGYSHDEISELARIGDMITFKDGISTLGNGLIAGKAMDNRVGVFTLLEVARRLNDVDLEREIAFCFSVRHEVGALGIPAIVSDVRPDQAIVLDVALSSDYPHGTKGRLGQSDLNDGPVLWRGVDLSESMVNCLRQIAFDRDIDVQEAAWNRFTPTNASHVMKVGPAVQTTLLSIPHRYPHGPNSVVAIQDIINLIELLEAAIPSKELKHCCVSCE